MKTNYPKYRIAAAIAPAFLHLVLFFKLLNRVMPVVGDAILFWLTFIISMYLVSVNGNYSLMKMGLLLMVSQCLATNRYVLNSKDKREPDNDFIFWLTFIPLITGTIFFIAGPYAVMGLIAAWVMLTLPMLGGFGLVFVVYKGIKRLSQPKDAAS